MSPEEWASAAIEGADSVALNRLTGEIGHLLLRADVRIEDAMLAVSALILALAEVVAPSDPKAFVDSFAEIARRGHDFTHRKLQ